MSKKKSNVTEQYYSVDSPAKLDRIVIDINGKKLELSNEEARSLLGVLKTFFESGWHVQPQWINPNYPWTMTYETTTNSPVITWSTSNT